jgi:glycosyltransferase involved in cell wall biosynthesis
MRILLISPWFPYPPENGSKIRIYNILRILAKNNQVSLISFTREGENVNRCGIESLGISVETSTYHEFSPQSPKAIVGLLSPVPRSVVDTYRNEMAIHVRRAVLQDKPDLVIASQLTTAPYLKEAVNTPRIFDEVELGLYQQNWSTSSSALLRIRRIINWRKVQNYIKKLLRECDACTVVSEVERNHLKQIISDDERVFIIPNGVDNEYLNSYGAQPQPHTLIFPGALTYKANFDAVDYFLRNVFPIIKEQCSDVILRITGSTNGVDLGRLMIDDHVIFTGFLQEVHSLIASSWVCIVPLRFGGGTRLKILESMALGTPVVATTKGAEGLNVEHGLNILIADDPSEMAVQVMKLFNSVELRKQLSQGGKLLVEGEYDWKIIENMVAKMLLMVHMKKHANK